MAQNRYVQGDLICSPQIHQFFMIWWELLLKVQNQPIVRYTTVAKLLRGSMIVFEVQLKSCTLLTW